MNHRAPGHRTQSFAIAEEVGVSVWTVRRYLRQKSKGRRWHCLDEADTARAISSLKAGKARSKHQPRRYAPPFGQLVLKFE